MTTRLTVDLSKVEHRRIKMAASMMGISMKEVVLISFAEFMQRKPNKATAKALKQSEAGKGLKEFDSLADLFEDLGI